MINDSGADTARDVDDEDTSGDEGRPAAVNPTKTGADGTYRWRRMSLEELAAMYRSEMRPALKRAGHDPHPYPPTYQQLVDAGLSGLKDPLREEWGLTVREFFVDHVPGIKEPSAGDSSPWAVATEETREALEAWMETLDRREDVRESTLNTKQYRLRTFLITYHDLYGEAPLVERVQDRENEYDERDRVIAVFDVLDEDLDSSRSKLRYLGEVERFYKWAMRRRGGQFNPARDLTEEFGWEREKPDSTALADRQVEKLYAEAETDRERLVILGLCAWGLRTSEVAALHVSQLALDGDDPHIAFDERKNAPGTVSMLYGRAFVEDRIDNLATNPNWNGYLFPSSRSESGHLTDETIRSIFQDLADRADITVVGGKPLPKMGRRWWYQVYAEVSTKIEVTAYIASEQGSSDTQVVKDHYDDEDERRKRRQPAMRERLGDVFEN